MSVGGGSMNFLYEEPGSMTFVSIEMRPKLPKDAKKTIFKNCSRGCNAVVTGKSNPTPYGPKAIKIQDFSLSN